MTFTSDVYDREERDKAVEEAATILESLYKEPVTMERSGYSLYFRFDHEGDEHHFEVGLTKPAAILQRRTSGGGWDTIYAET